MKKKEKKNLMFQQKKKSLKGGKFIGHIHQKYIHIYIYFAMLIFNFKHF